MGGKTGDTIRFYNHESLDVPKSKHAIYEMRQECVCLEDRFREAWSSALFFGQSTAVPTESVWLPDRGSKNLAGDNLLTVE